MKEKKESKEAVQTDAYSLFVYAIRTQITRDYYLRRLRTFFDFIKLLPNSRKETRCNRFASIAIKHPDWTFGKIIGFLQFQKERVELVVTTANQDSTTGSYHVRGTIKNLGENNLEYVSVTGIFYENDNKTVGVSTCCYTDPNTIEPGRTASFDSFAQEEEVSSTPTSFRVSLDWEQ